MPNAFLRWKFVDPHDPTLGAEFTFPRNPNTMTTPFARRNITSTATTAINGRKIVTEGQTPPAEWTFGGNIHNSTHYEELRSWVYERTGRRVYLYDHFGRRVTLIPLLFNPTPKRAVGQYWRHTYEITAMVLDITGPTFMVEPPLAPRNFVVVPGHLRADLTWDPPTSVGGSALVEYEVDLGGGDLRHVFSGSPLAYAAKPITAGPKTFTVTTVTAGGRSVPATQSVTVDSKGAPSGFVITSCTVGRDTITLKWTDPTDDGGEALRGWIITLESTTGAYLGALGPHNYAAGIRSATLTGLTPNAKYTVYLYAQNGIGSITIPQTTKRLVTTLK